MKKILALLAASTLTAGAAFAQTQPQASAQAGQYSSRPGGYMAMTPDQRADRMAQRLTQELGLSAEQTEKVRQLSLAQSQQVQTMRGSAGGDRQAMRPELKAMRDQQDAKLKDILTADQYTRYTQLREERGGQMEKAKEKNDKLKEKLKDKS